MIPTKTADPALSTDLHGLGSLRKGAAQKDPATIKAVAQQFEALFMQMMLKSMRGAKLAEGAFESDAGNTFQDMHDRQIATSLSAEGHGLGLSDMIYRQMMQSSGLKLDDGKEKGPLQLPERNNSLDQYGFNAKSVGAIEPLAQPKDVTSTKKVQAETTKTENGITTTPTAAVVTTPYIEEKIVQPQAEEVAVITDQTEQQQTSEVDNDPVLLTPEDFITKMLPMAEKAAAQLGVEPKVLLAQAALETGWGRAVIRRVDGSNSYNLFNIKADSRWSGDSVMKQSLEYNNGVAEQVRSPFRAYDNYQQSFDDYVQFIRNSPRYAGALQVADNPSKYLQQLQQSGYATDPNYASKIEAIMQRNMFSQQSAQNGYKESNNS